MMRAWVNLLPLFVVKALARRYCGTVTVAGARLHHATKGVWIAAPAEKGGE